MLEPTPIEILKDNYKQMNAIEMKELADAQRQ